MIWKHALVTTFAWISTMAITWEGYSMEQKPNRTEDLRVEFNLVRMLYLPGDPLKLSVKVINKTPDVLDFMTFSNPDCFAHFYLDMKLFRVKAGKNEALEIKSPGCSIRKWPGSEVKIQAGQSYSYELGLNSFLSGNLEEGNNLIDIDWKNEALADYLGGKYRHKFSSYSLDVTELYVLNEREKVKLSVDKSVKLKSGLELTLIGHSHKRTREGDVSPLITYFKVKAKDIEDKQVQINLKPPQQFILEGYGFETIVHEYDRSMELFSYGRLQRP